MIFGQDRDELRQMYVDAWKKSAEGKLLSPLETQIAAVIEDHPEYQSAIGGGDLAESFSVDGGKSNPYLHMGLHLALREQVSTNRPAGITQVFEQVRTRLGNPHQAEHALLECLAQTLWEAQRDNALPDDAIYLERLKSI